MQGEYNRLSLLWEPYTHVHSRTLTKLVFRVEKHPRCLCVPCGRTHARTYLLYLAHIYHMTHATRSCTCCEKESVLQDLKDVLSHRVEVPTAANGWFAKPP